MDRSQFWTLLPATIDEHYIPDAQEIAEMREHEKEMKECDHKKFSDEDGCLDCGYYSK
jgi:hypothetical protein